MDSSACCWRCGIAAKYVGERWAFLATVAIWWASSLPVYMYFNPSWSHAHSAFVVALFLWYWHETRETRSTTQWIVLAAIAGLMLNVYYPNAMVLAVLVVEAVPQYFGGAATATQSPCELESDIRAGRAFLQLAMNHALFAVVMIACLLPTFVSRYVIYGNPFESGYVSLKDWAWRSPYFLAVLFSSEHGLLVVDSGDCAGLHRCRDLRVARTARWRRDPRCDACVLFLHCVLSGLGRHFVLRQSILRFADSDLHHWLERFLRSRRAILRIATNRDGALGTAVALLVAWNLAFIFQWGTHLVPARGPIVWSEMIHNQFAVVPREIAAKGSRLYVSSVEPDAADRAARHRANACQIARSGNDSAARR